MSALPRQGILERFAQALEGQGWERLSADGEAPSSLHVEEPRGTREAEMGLFRRGDRTLAVVDFARGERPPDPDESPKALFERYLDLSLLERLALWGVCGARGADLLFCAAPEGCRLLDTAIEMPLASCGPRPSDQDLERCAAETDEEAERKTPLPDAQVLAEELKRWFSMIEGRLGRAPGLSRADVGRFARHALLGHKRLAASGDAHGLGALGLTVSTQGAATAIEWRPPPALDAVDALLAASHDCAPEATGAFAPLERRALRRALRSLDPAVLAVATGGSRLCAAKFRTTVQLRALMPVDREHASWRLALTDPLRVEREIDSRDLYVFQPMELDWESCGVGRVLEAVEKLALYAPSEDRNLRRAGGRQLDMVESAPERPGAPETDPFNWLCRHALRVRVSEEFRETLGYLVASHTIDLWAGEPFRAIPRAALTALPALFSASPPALP